MEHLTKNQLFSRRVKLDGHTRNAAKDVSPGQQTDRWLLSFAKRPDAGLPTRDQRMGTSVFQAHHPPITAGDVPAWACWLAAGSYREAREGLLVSAGVHECYTSVVGGKKGDSASTRWHPRIEL